MGGGLRMMAPRTKERIWERGQFWGYQIEIDPTERAWSGTVYEEGGRVFAYTRGKRSR